MARLPVPGGDEGNWGDILNQYLEVAHDDQGQLRSSAVGDALPPLTNTHIDAAANIDQSKIANLVTDLEAKFAKSTLTVKGDLPVATGSGLIDRLAAGTNGQLLTVDSGTTSGLRWANAPAVSVKDYGATGNGSTDDTAAIQAAVNATASAKGSLYFPAGTYLVGTAISIPANINLFGQGYDSHLTRTTTGNVFSIIGTSGTLISNVHITELRFSGPSTQASSVSGNGIYIDYTSYITVENCFFTGFGLTNSNDGGISGIRSSYISVIGNNFRLNTNGLCFGTPNSTIGTDHSLIAHNICLSNWEDGLHTQQCSYITMANNICGNNGQVSDGAGIDVLRDSYDTMEGNLCFSNGGNGIEVGSGTSADTGHVISNNINYQNGGNGISVANLSTKCAITSNNCSGNIGHGINISPSGTASATIESMVVTNNQAQGNGGNGINISNPTASSIVRYAVVSGNTVQGNTSHGILLTARVEYNLVANNIVVSNTSNGIRLSSQSTNIPNHNVISGNILVGNATQLGQSGDTNSTVINNKGHNPQGIAAITVGASPYTYTAGSTPETIYISGGTVSAVVKSSTTLYSQSNVSVRLESNQAVTVTYSSAPTMIKDRL